MRIMIIIIICNKAKINNDYYNIYPIKVRTSREATWSSSSSRRGKRSANGAGALLRSVKEGVGMEEKQSEETWHSESPMEETEDGEQVCVDSSGKLRKDREEWEVKVNEEEDKCVFCKCQQHVICKLRKCQQTKGGTK